jgi:hypothetical protein
MLLNLSMCNIVAGTAAQERALRHPGGCHTDDNMGCRVFRRWEQHLHVTSTAHLNAGHPWTVQMTPANEDVITAVVE